MKVIGRKTMGVIIFALALVALNLVIARFGADSRPTISVTEPPVRWI
jgi:hypothetical protein